MKINISCLINEDTLRNLGELPTIIKNETRKYGKCEMQKRFSRIKYEGMQEYDCKDIEISTDFEGIFTNKTTKYEKMLAAIHVRNTKRQAKGSTIAACRDAVNTLIKAIEEEKQVFFYLCMDAS